MKFGLGKFNGFWPFLVGPARRPEELERSQPDSNPRAEALPDAREFPKD